MKSNRIKDESCYYYGKGHNNNVLRAKKLSTYLHAQKLRDK